MINPSREKGMDQRIRHLMRCGGLLLKNGRLKRADEKYQGGEPGSVGNEVGGEVRARRHREKTLTEKAPRSISRQRYHGSGVTDVEIMKGRSVGCGWVWARVIWNQQKASPKNFSRAGDGRERHSVHVTGPQKKRSE
jgi:hypothetical protein